MTMERKAENLFPEVVKPANEIEQPDNKQFARRRYQGGSKRAQLKLQSLRFDPIEELVKKYRKIEEEIERMDHIRDGALVVLNPRTGEKMGYNPELHMNLYDKLTKVAADLLRYGYGRVPETVNVNDRPPTPMIVQLTQEGDTYVINESEVFDEEDGDGFLD